MDILLRLLALTLQMLAMFVSIAVTSDRRDLSSLQSTEKTPPNTPHKYYM